MSCRQGAVLRRVRNTGRLARAASRARPSAFCAARLLARLARLRRCLARPIPAGHGGGALRAASRSASSTCCTGAISSASCRASAFPVSRGAARELNLAWHRLDAWPDVPPGMARLKQPRHAGAGVERQHLADGRSGAPERNSLGRDLGAETAGDYKPKPRVYLAACEALDLPPGDCMMVAAHTNDLLAAAKCGLLTGAYCATE